MQWQWSTFKDLSVEQLYEILALRQKVFILEQNCLFLDMDGLDQLAWHLSGWKIESSTSPVLCSYLRVIPAGHKFAEPSIGRVVTAPDARGKGYGKAIMEEALKNLRAELGSVPIRISAQAYLEKFYREMGFVTVSETYLEDGIPHIEMLTHGQ